MYALNIVKCDGIEAFNLTTIPLLFYTQNYAYCNTVMWNLGKSFVLFVCFYDFSTSWPDKQPMARCYKQNYFYCNTVMWNLGSSFVLFVCFYDFSTSWPDKQPVARCHWDFALIGQFLEPIVYSCNWLAPKKGPIFVEFNSFPFCKEIPIWNYPN